MKKSFLVMTIIGAVLSFRAVAYTVEYGPFAVSSLRFGPDGLYVKFNPAPASCGGGDQYRMHAKVSSSALNYKELTSALLTAYTAEQRLIYIWVTNEGICSGERILELSMIELQSK